MIGLIWSSSPRLIACSMSVSKAVSVITYSCLALLAIYLSTMLFTRGLQSICLQSCLPEDCNLSVYKVVYQRIAIYLSTKLFTRELQCICVQSCFTRGLQSICLQCCLPEDCNLSVYKVAIYLSTVLFTRGLQSICLPQVFTRVLSICLQHCFPEDCNVFWVQWIDFIIFCFIYDAPSVQHIEQHDHYRLQTRFGAR